jgi:hypothetical protein
MKEYYLALVGLRTVLRTPDEITISERMRPFLCGPHTETDCTITVQPCSALPAFSESGVWHGAEFYDRCAGTMRIFHCSAPKTEAFAVTQLDPEGNITVDVLKNRLSYFQGTSGIFNRIGLETLLLQHKGLLLHASLIEYKGNAIAFTGPSGVGKSTQADLWHRCVGAEILNGDRAALRKMTDGWHAFGSPYAGTSGIYKNQSAPLKALIVLRQGKENCIRPLGAAEALRYIYPEVTVHHWEKDFVAAVTDLCLNMLENIPIYLLECRPEEGAVQLLKEGLML